MMLLQASSLQKSRSSLWTNCFNWGVVMDVGYSLPQPSCFEIIQVKLSYADTHSWGLFANIDDIDWYDVHFPTSQHRDYFDRSDSESLTILVNTSQGEYVYSVYRCLVIDNIGWLEVHNSTFLDMQGLDIVNMELWHTAELEWCQYNNSKDWRAYAEDIDNESIS